ncbi:hypothetical protein LINPERPRIM_LOCUS34284 [Linum perenne]
MTVRLESKDSDASEAVSFFAPGNPKHQAAAVKLHKFNKSFRIILLSLLSIAGNSPKSLKLVIYLGTLTVMHQ